MRLILINEILIDFQANMEPDILGKRISQRIGSDHTWLTIGDSHVSHTRLGDWNALWGVSSVSISGGQLRHVRAWLEKNHFMKKFLRAFIVMIGGNDLFEVGPSVFAESLMNLVREVSSVNKQATIVTGSIIPRKLDDEGIKSVRVGEQIDDLIVKSAVLHHHFETDAFQTDAKVPRVIGTLFAPDGTHLNRSGNDVFKATLSFVYDSLNFNDFSGVREIPVPGHASKTIAWKF